MKTLFKTTTLLLFYAMVSGCSGSSVKGMRTNMIDTKNEGMLVGTISFEDRKGIPPRRSFRYKPQKLPFKESRQSIDSLVKTGHYNDYYDSVLIKSESGDFKEDKKWIYYFTIVKPAGKYRFYELFVALNTGHMQSYRTFPLEIPFEIESGKIKYFGEIKYNIKNGTIEILDKVQRDRAKFKAKFPQISF